MTASTHTMWATRQTRRRAMIVPREHGAWGLLLVPIFTGVVAGFAPEHRILALLQFALLALSLFLLRTPIESLLGTGAIVARTSDERWTALIASTGLGFLSSACLLGLMWNGQYPALWLLGAATAGSFVLQAVLRTLSRSTRMISQVVGAFGLTCTAPVAYYIGTGQLDTRAFVLWIANWIFAGNQIHFVQLRIHAARANTFAEKFERGGFFFVAQAALLALLVFASRWKIVPALAILAFLPAVVRGSAWFFRKAEALNVKSLGWSEMKHGVAFGLLLAIAFRYG
jgi:hypothetical protein